MKLIFHLILIIVLLNLCASYINLGKITRGSWRDFSTADKPRYVCYYVDTNDFQKDSNIYFKVRLTYGSFSSGYMYYGGANTLHNEGVDLNLPHYVYRDSYSSTSTPGIYLYKDYTYFFIVPKPNYRYLYIAPPPTFNYDRILSRITVYNTDKFGISIWVWIGIGAFVLVVIILSIVFYRCKRAQRKAEEESLQNPTVDPIPLNASPDSNEPKNVNPNPIPPPTPAPYVPNPVVYAPVPSPYAPVPYPPPVY
jgi:hypothetical protein